MLTSHPAAGDPLEEGLKFMFYQANNPLGAIRARFYTQLIPYCRHNDKHTNRMLNCGPGALYKYLVENPHLEEAASASHFAFVMHTYLNGQTAINPLTQPARVITLPAVTPAIFRTPPTTPRTSNRRVRFADESPPQFASAPSTPGSVASCTVEDNDRPRPSPSCTARKLQF